MKITEDVRRYAAEQGISDAEALRARVIDKAREFADTDSELYSQP
jgi:phosphomethylpyrimidine synthase